MIFLKSPRTSEIRRAFATLIFAAMGLIGYHALPTTPGLTKSQALPDVREASEDESPPISIPPSGSPIVFYNASVWSDSLLRRPVWSVDESWDKRCKVMVATVLEENGFAIQPYEAPHAVRGKRDGINLGVHCLSGQSHLLIFGVYARTRADQGRLVAEQFERRLRGAWGDLSL